MGERRRHRAVLIGAIAAVMAGCGQSRQDDIADRGADVMPFDLDATTHAYTQTADGGIQTVTSDDPDADEQVKLVRDHLKLEAAAFAAGDFGDPVDIHGADMPGVVALSAAAERVRIDYVEIDAGAQLVFSTSDLSLVAAVRDWFAAQTADHGKHASP